jgi:hypothetical protein
VSDSNDTGLFALLDVFPAIVAAHREKAIKIKIAG